MTIASRPTRALTVRKHLAHPAASPGEPAPGSVELFVNYLALTLALLLGVLVPAAGAHAQAEPGDSTPGDTPEAPVEPDGPADAAPDELEDELETEGEAEPEPEVSEPEPEVSEPEPEVSEPEPEVSEPEPEVSEPAPSDPLPGEEALGEGGGALGSAADAPALEPEPEVSDEAEPDPMAADGDGDDGPDTPSTADRLASPNPVVGGVKWSMPLVWSQSMTVRSLNEDAQTTFDPTYSWNFSARPRYIFRPNLTFGARLDVAVELTTNNFGQRFAFNDLTLDATYTLKQRPAGFMFVTAGTLRLPTSELSRASNRIIQPGARLTTIRPIPVLKGLIVGGGLAYSYWINATNVADERRDQPSFPCSVGGTEGSQQLDDCTGTGTGNIEHTFSASLFATLIPISHLNLNLGFTSIWTRNADLAGGCIDGVVGPPVPGSPCPPGAVFSGDNSDTKWGSITSFGFSVGYDILSYLTVSVGMSTLAFHPNVDGDRIENPFFNEKSVFFLSAQFRPAGLYAERHPANADD